MCTWPQTLRESSTQRTRRVGSARNRVRATSHPETRQREAQRRIEDLSWKRSQWSSRVALGRPLQAATQIVDERRVRTAGEEAECQSKSFEHARLIVDLFPPRRNDPGRAPATADASSWRVGSRLPRSRVCRSRHRVLQDERCWKVRHLARAAVPGLPDSLSVRGDSSKSSGRHASQAITRH